MMVMVEAFSHRPLWQLYTADAAANDKRFGTEIMAALPVGELLVFDLRFFSFLWFDDFTASHRFFVTRMREKIAYRTVQELSSGPSYRDEIIQMASTIRIRVAIPCAWSRCCGRRVVSLSTNVLDPQRLSARQVCELYRRRWRIEDAFALTKRVGFVVLVDRLHQCRAVADLRHPDFLCGAADDLPAGGRGLGEP